MKISGFELSPNVHFQKGAVKDAMAIGRHLEMLRKKGRGELTPEAVVADATHNNSPLHSFFEWDDSEAAQQYRLQQARGLIRAVVAIYPRKKGEPVKQRAYVHILQPTPHYQEVSHAMSQKETRDIVLKRAWSELQAWRLRYKELEEFAAFVDIIDLIDSDFPKLLDATGKQ
jgi:hypothetical protein